MPTRKITYADKAEGVIWSSNDANEIKEVVNSHADAIDELTFQVEQQSERTESAVLSVGQTLTEEQKETARNNIDVESPQIVDIRDLDTLTDTSLFMYGKKSRFTVLNGRFKVGVLDMFSDSMHHVLTQVFTTTEQINENGQLTGGHTDNDVKQYYRSYNYNSPYLPNARYTWTPWRILNTKKEEFDTFHSQMSDFYDHTSIIEFNGFVDNVQLREMSIVLDEPMIFFDRVRKTFVVSGNGTVFFNNFSTTNEEKSMRDYQTSIYMEYSSVKPRLWTSRIYKCKTNGKSFMWNGTDLAPLCELGCILIDDMQTTVTPEALYKWGAVTALRLTLSEGNVHGKEYMLEFTVDSADFDIYFSEQVRWLNDEVPEWEIGWTYQVSIENGLAVAGGWNANG